MLSRKFLILVKKYVNKDFNDAISFGTNQTIKVKQRFHMAGGMFREVFGDQPA